MFSLLLLIAAAMYHGEEDLFYEFKILEREKNTNALKNKDNNTLDAKIQLLWDKVNSIESTVNNKDEKDQ